MSKTFHLDIMTPERRFFGDDAEGLIVTAPDGELCILPCHVPLVAPVIIGEIRIKQHGEWKKAFTSEGFLEVLHDKVMVFTQMCEWPEEIDAAREKLALEQENEHLRQKQSMIEYRESKITMARAMAKLRITRQNINFK